MRSTPVRLDLSAGIAFGSAALVCTDGRSAWFVGVLVLAVYLVFASTLYRLPPSAG